VRRGDITTHIDANILPVLFWLFGRRLAAVFRYCTGETNMATRKKKAKAKRTNKKVKQAKTDKPSMTDQLKEARTRYTVSKSSKGSTSAHNGDDLATLLAGCSPEDVCTTAEQLANLKAGELMKKYGHLNPGQVRMCSGNRIRALVKKEIVTVDDVAKTLAAL